MTNFRVGAVGARIGENSFRGQSTGGLHCIFIEISSHLASPVQAETKSIALHYIKM